ncbi:PQQ-binding-like beta-propeller repeat protein [Nonomuraea rhodomycinica]|uniref:PQQ-binding-like beta-propeller repeat protein n=1 Tax=Nonomuraea rhodomycinica TaxID=1712872 RepID=A0A7Y6MBQ3_9ACTN|nr:PQQ-binding-like beta-propeller repeat protein [Nonomuraea rhodomycinica]NUW42573.1 PQQ-binding-like beta-propeller repeat protein [Nonomuraea rhodomycinica]
MLSARGVAASLAAALAVCLAPASDSADATRRAVGWEAVWSVTLTQGSDRLWRDPVGEYAAEVSQGVVALGLGRGPVVVIDAGTGRIRSRMRPEGSGNVRRIWVTGDTLVVQRGAAPSGFGAPAYLAAYDLPTAAPLWVTYVAGDEEFAEVTPRGVAIARPSRLDLYDLRRGTATGGVPVRPGCATRVAAAGAAVAVLSGCPGEAPRLSAIDPATGRARWQRVLPYTTPPGDRAGKGMETAVQGTADGSVLVRVNQTSLLYAPDGRPLPGVLSPAPEARVVTTGRVLAHSFAPASPDGRPEAAVTQAFDPGGRGLLRTRRTGASGPLFADGRTFVAMDVMGWTQGLTWPLPAHLTSVDAVTGETADLPLPVPHAMAELVGAGGGLAFVLDPVPETLGGDGPAARVTAYRLMREERPRAAPLGAVEASRWPDACRLLTAADLAPLGGGHRAFPRTPAPRLPRPLGAADTTGTASATGTTGTSGTARMPGRAGAAAPGHVACDWIPPADDGTVVFVSVEWAAPSAREARELFAAETARLKADAGVRVLPSGRPDVLLHGLGTPAGTQFHALVVAGPVVARLMTRSEAAVRLLGPRLRDNLRAATAGGAP